MAEDRGITFYGQLHGETPAGTLLKFDEITMTQYFPFGPEWEVDTIVSYNNVTNIDQMQVVNTDDPTILFGNINLTDILNIGRLELTDLMNILPTVDSHVTLIDLTYGRNEETGKELHLCLDLILNRIYYQSDNVSINYCNYTWQVFTKYTEPGQADVTKLINSATINVGPGLNIHGLKFGIIFMYPLDRVATLDNAIMLFFMASFAQTSEDNYFTIVPTNNTSFTYNMHDQYTYNIQNGYYAYMVAAIDMANLTLENMVVAEVGEESPEAGPASDEGGYEPHTGGFDDSSDTIGVPNLPTLGASNIGFINVYEVTAGSLQLFANELFPPLVYTPPTSITATDTTGAIVAAANQFIDFLTYIPQFFNQINAEKYINYVLDCHIIPVDPTAESGNTAIQVGNKTLMSYGHKVTSDYVEVDCGAISLAEYYANFADFLTSFKLFLPFVGFVPAQPEWFYRESIQVVYHFNVIDGSFIAYVLSTGAYVNNNNSGRTILGQYGGNCCVHIPITGQAYASMFQNVMNGGISAVKSITSAVSGVAGGIASAAMGGPAGMVGGALNAGNAVTSGLEGAASSMLSTVGAKPDVVSSNPYSASGSFLSCRRPFAMIERPVSSYPTTYAKENGIPANVSRQLGKVTGFNIIGNIHLDGINATEAEKAEIEELLGSGVIL